MKVVTGVSLFKVAAGQRISITYSILNEEGEFIKENVKVSRIVTDDAVLNNINNILEVAKNIIDTVEE